MALSCPRCGEPLQLLDSNTPPFCGQCGLPQLRISPEAMAPANTSGAPPASPALMDWARGLWLAGLGGLVGAGLPALLPGAVVSGAASGIGLLFMPLLTLLAVVAQRRSRPPYVLAPVDGGRLGALLGLAVGCLLAWITGATGFYLRYIRHSRIMDDRISQTVAQLPEQLSAAGTSPAEVLGLIQSPEFRAGTFILSHVFSLLLLVAVGALSGWASASILRQWRQRSIPPGD